MCGATVDIMSKHEVLEALGEVHDKSEVGSF